MKNHKVLKPKQQLAVRLLALGHQKNIVAQRLDVSTMTLYRWEQSPNFQNELATSIESSGLKETARKLHIAGITAAETIQEFLNNMSHPAEVRAKFAVGVLRAYPAFQSAIEKGLRNRVGDFNLDERWLSHATYDSHGNLIADAWANTQSQIRSPEGSLVV